LITLSIQTMNPNLNFLEAIEETGAKVFDFLDDLAKGTLKYHVKEGNVVITDGEITKYKLKKNPDLEKAASEILSKDLPSQLKVYYTLERFLDEHSQKEVLMSICEQIYDQLPFERKTDFSPLILYVTSMNLGVIEINRPPYVSEDFRNVIPYLSHLKNRDKIEQIIINEGFRRIEKSKNPEAARGVVEEYLTFLRSIEHGPK